MAEYCSAVYTIDCLREDWLPLAHNSPNRLSWGELDFMSLHAELSENGFISETSKWSNPSDSDRDAELKKIEEIEGFTLKPWRGGEIDRSGSN